ncbi:porin [uncultured Dialister sp.]|uniref:porin n=1 Tax=uncultured Dialister sp. TaxID=278064 RepID=UPI0025E4D5C0|nr:S-layer homology domain-containing protein [uncultured Dialister sp.]
MKKILAIAAVAALTAGVSAYAANPFSDVTPDDWAYQAVSDLSDQGVVEGYPDGTFKGERNMTRYELAQIIARLMAKEDQLNAEQRATLDKLAGEYADELANLGVRVGNLEKKVGNIYWSGDARMRYQDKSVDAKDSWNGRMRINVKGQVNDSTYVQGCMTSNMDFKGDQTASTAMDTLFVNHNFGKNVAVRLGRQPVVFGNQGGWLYGDANGYDGAQVSYNNAKFGATVGFGQFNASDYNDVKTSDALFAKAGYDFGFAKLGADYIKFQKDTKEDLWQGQELYGVNLNIPVQKFNVFGEYWKNTTANNGGYDTAWNAGLSYGAANWKKPGTWDLAVAYNDVDAGVFFGGTGLQTNVLSYLTKDGYEADNVTFWNALANVTLAKNVQLHGEYAFDVDTEGADSDKTQDAWTVSLNYKF